MTLITKSDFKIGHDCLHKLKYKKAKYPSKMEENEYLKFFADCGFMVEALAHALFPEGKAPTPIGDESLAQATSRVFSEPGDAVWFEPTFVANGFSARVDMMARVGSTLELIEIKAKSYDPSEDGSLWAKKGGGVTSEWESYLIDVAFQTMVVKLAHPDFHVVPKLCLVDMSKTCTEEALYNKIELRKRDDSDRSAPSAVFCGDASKLKDDHLLVFVDVSEYVDHLMPEVVEAAGYFRDVISGSSPIGDPPIGASCKTCEYRGLNLSPSGFAECWGELASAEPHILDMYYASSLGDKGGLERVISSGRAGILDIDESTIDGGKAVGARQIRQIRAVKSGQEQVTDDLRHDLSSLSYPLYFLDFETSRIPVPYHVGMNPYEQIAFQFSCHVLRTSDSVDLEHFEWINTDDVYPSFEFAQQLRHVLGDDGTIFVWSPFEQTTIKDIVRQASKYKFADANLVSWLSNLHVGTKDGGRIFDLMRLCERGYYHPAMNGRVGIKYVLKAIWQNTPWLWDDPWFADYVKKDGGGQVLDPYLSLSAEPFAYASERTGLELEVVREGVGAMRTYQEMLYGAHRGDVDFRSAQRDLLLQYCKLDTAAMVIVWKYWMSLVSK